MADQHAESQGLERIESDFVTFFNALWYQDFPVDRESYCGRADWTIHIGVCVRRCAELLGFRAFFESGNRTDAVIRDSDGDDRVRVEWEWTQAFRESVNEIAKLRAAENAQTLSVFISYSRLAEHHELNLRRIEEQWDVDRPLLVFLVTFELDGGDRRFLNFQTYRARAGKVTLIREQPALPWNVVKSRWYRP